MHLSIDVVLLQLCLFYRGNVFAARIAILELNVTKGEDITVRNVKLHWKMTWHGNLSGVIVGDVLDVIIGSNGMNEDAWIVQARCGQKEKVWFFL